MLLRTNDTGLITWLFSPSLNNGERRFCSLGTDVTWPKANLLSKETLPCKCYSNIKQWVQTWKYKTLALLASVVIKDEVLRISIRVFTASYYDISIAHWECFLMNSIVVVLMMLSTYLSVRFRFFSIWRCACKGGWPWAKLFCIILHWLCRSFTIYTVKTIWTKQKKSYFYDKL